MSILAAVSYIPFVGLFTAIPCVVFWIWYWVKIYSFQARLAGWPEAA